MAKHSIPVGFSFLKIFFIIFLISSCSARGKTLATVGDYTIKEKDAQQREQIAKIFYPDATQKDIGLKQLVETYSYAQILHNHGMDLTNEVLEHEAERIDKETRAADTIKKIKEVFGNDRESYLKVFVLPTYAERIIYFGFFLRDKEAQAIPLQLASELLQIGQQKPGIFLEEAKKRGLKINSYFFDVKNGFQNEEMAKRRIEEEKNIPPQAKQALQEAKINALKLESNYFMRNKTFSAKKGAVIPEPFDASDFFLILQLNENPSPKKLSFKGVFVPKVSYANWLEKEKAKFTIKLH